MRMRFIFLKKLTYIKELQEASFHNKSNGYFKWNEAIFMLIDTRQIILLTHILLGIVWVGGILFVGWGVYPVVKKLKISEQRMFLTEMMKHTHYLFSLAGAGVIATGVSLGTIFGPIKTWDALFSTTYGRLFSTAFIVGIVTLIWGIFISYPTTMRMLQNNFIWKNAEFGKWQSLQREMMKVTFVTGIEVVGFIVLLTLMVLL